MEIGNIRLNFTYTDPQIADIKRCLSMLYSTRAGSQPLDRNFGIDYSCLDKPLPVAQNLFTLEVVDKTREYETRAKVDNVTFDFGVVDGKMYPTIYLTRGEEE